MKITLRPTKPPKAKMRKTIKDKMEQWVAKAKSVQGVNWVAVNRSGTVLGFSSYPRRDGIFGTNSWWLGDDEVFLGEADDGDLRFYWEYTATDV